MSLGLAGVFPVRWALEGRGGDAGARLQHSGHLGGRQQCPGSSRTQLKRKINEEFSEHSLYATGAAAVWVPRKKGGEVAAQSASPRGSTMETLPGCWLEAENSLRNAPCETAQGQRRGEQGGSPGCLPSGPTCCNTHCSQKKALLGPSTHQHPLPSS